MSNDAQSQRRLNSLKAFFHVQDQDNEYIVNDRIRCVVEFQGAEWHAPTFEEAARYAYAQLELIEKRIELGVTYLRDLLHNVSEAHGQQLDNTEMWSCQDLERFNADEQEGVEDAPSVMDDVWLEERRNANDARELRHLFAKLCVAKCGRMAVLKQVEQQVERRTKANSEAALERLRAEDRALLQRLKKAAALPAARDLEGTPDEDEDQDEDEVDVSDVDSKKAESLLIDLYLLRPSSDLP